MLRRAPVHAVAVALALSAAGCLHARGTPEEPVVVGFALEGVHAVKADDLAEHLATQASGRWAWSDAYRLDPDALAADKRRVEAYYRARGYYDARVGDVRLDPAGAGRVKVVLRVSEGEPVRVRKLTVAGLDAEPEARARAGKLPLKEGDVFTEGAYDATRSSLQQALRDTGWATAEVTQHAEVLPDTHAAEVTYDVKAGARYRFGAVFVAGTASVPRDRIRDQALGAVKPGEWFDESALAIAQKRVFDLGVFGGVRVTPGQADLSRGTIPVIVAVREAPFHTVRVGPGLGFSAIRWDATAMAGWEHRNWLGDLRHLSTELRLGYAWLPDPFRRLKEGTVGLAAVEFSQPGALTRYVDTSARLEVEKGIEQAYDFYSERLRLGLPLRLASRWTLVPSYNLEVYELSNAAVTFDPSAPTVTGPLLQNCNQVTAAGGATCLLTYLEQRIAWDGRDNPLNTRRGLYVGLSVQEGFHLAQYGYQYVRFLPELRFFLPLGAHSVFAVRSRVGALVPINEKGDPPIVARFNAGGPLSMRGYYTRRLSKMVLQNNQWVPVGGNGLADGTAELRFDISGNWGGAIFVDAGNVSDASGTPSTWKEALDPTTIQWASGMGVRYRTPFGPLRLDVGVRLPSFSTDSHPFPAVPFTRYPDGTPHREPIMAVHASLGEAF
jgi:translocation and assembly module TamA